MRPIFARLPRLALAPAALLGALAATPLAASDAPEPEVVRLLNLTEIRRDRDQDLRGVLPGGETVKIELDWNGAVEEIESATHRPFPASAVAAALPRALTSGPDWMADAQLWKVEFDDDDRSVELEGVDADGFEFEAEYDASGRLREIERRD